MNDEVKNEETEAVAEETTETSTTTTTSNNDGFAAGDTPEFKWYIAKTMTGQENKVARSLKENIVNHKLTEFFAEVLVPEETVVSHANGRKRTIKKKFFPGYVLIKMIMNDTTWHLVKNSDKITGFVGGTPMKPAPITEEEALYMTNQATGQAAAQPRVTFSYSEGDQVRVTEGPFATFVGTVEAVNDKGKIKVNVSIFGRPTPVELDFSQVEKVN